MQTIRTITDLIAELRASPPGTGYERILDRADIPFSELEHFCRWNNGSYTRTCLERNDDLELLLICYEPGQRTSIHDYDTQHVWVYPVLGTVKEERFQLDPNGKVRRISGGLLQRSSFLHLGGGQNIHRHINPGPGRAVTLNFYARPLKKWKVYDERSGEASTKAAGN